jgi:putative ABC transport system substrate-binding protein
MRRREFIAGLGGVASLPLAAYAQQASTTKSVAILMNLQEGDPEGQARLAAFFQGLRTSGWTQGSNLQTDIRWGAGNAERMRKYAAELVALSPDVILASTSTTVDALLQATRTVPIVFVQFIDPVGSGVVATLSRPGGNATGFTSFEYGTSGKWLELLKRILPRVTRAGVLRDPAITAGIGQFAAIQAVAPALGVELTAMDVRDAGEIERAISAFADGANGGLIVTGSPLAAVHRDLIISLSTRYRLPTVYFARYFVQGGGLISYGPDFVDQYRRAAEYVDRILKGETPAQLPVQAPTKFELAINIKAAKALGLEMPPDLISIADEVIE